MRTIPKSYSAGPDLHHLRVFDVLLREHSLTRAARELDVTQRALSKTLAQLRRFFASRQRTLGNRLPNSLDRIAV